jgi:CHAT domain-containing protein
MEQLYRRLNAGTPVAAALRDALISVRSMTRDDVLQALDRLGYQQTRDISGSGSSNLTIEDVQTCPFARPEYWAPFIVIGRP